MVIGMVSFMLYSLICIIWFYIPKKVKVILLSAALIYVLWLGLVVFVKQTIEYRANLKKIESKYIP